MMILHNGYDTVVPQSAFIVAKETVEGLATRLCYYMYIVVALSRIVRSRLSSQDQQSCVSSYSMLSR